MILLHMKFQVIFTFEFLPTNITLMILLNHFFPAKNRQLILYHAKVIQLALISIIDHLDIICAKDGQYLRFQAIYNML